MEPEVTAEERVVVFVDYMNTYKSARRAFDYIDPDEHWEGQIHPRTLGEIIVGRYTDAACELQEVRVYRGKPSNSKDSRGYAAFQRQVSIWEKINLVTVVTRDLRYPEEEGADPEEKGIDVLIALDFFEMAIRDQYDIGVLVSHDTDLVPALERTANLDTAEIAVASWEPDHWYGHRLRLKDREIRCHWLPRHDYQQMRDGRDYNTKTIIY